MRLVTINVLHNRTGSLKTVFAFANIPMLEKIQTNRYIQIYLMIQTLIKIRGISR